MPERTGQFDTLRAATPLRVGSATLLPIERVVVHSERSARGVWVSAAMEPYALIVRDAGGIRVIAVEALAVSLEELCEKTPELDALLASV